MRIITIVSLIFLAVLLDASLAGPALAKEDQADDDSGMI